MVSPNCKGSCASISGSVMAIWWSKFCVRHASGTLQSWYSLFDFLLTSYQKKTNTKKVFVQISTNVVLAVRGVPRATQANKISCGTCRLTIRDMKTWQTKNRNKILLPEGWKQAETLSPEMLDNKWAVLKRETEIRAEEQDIRNWDRPVENISIIAWSHSKVSENFLW